MIWRNVSTFCHYFMIIEIYRQRFPSWINHDNNNICFRHLWRENLVFHICILHATCLWKPMLATCQGDDHVGVWARLDILWYIIVIAIIKSCSWMMTEWDYQTSCHHTIKTPRSRTFVRHGNIVMTLLTDCAQLHVMLTSGILSPHSNIPCLLYWPDAHKSQLLCSLHPFEK